MITCETCDKYIHCTKKLAVIRPFTNEAVDLTYCSEHPDYKEQARQEMFANQLVKDYYDALEKELSIWQEFQEWKQQKEGNK